MIKQTLAALLLTTTVAGAVDFGGYEPRYSSPVPQSSANPAHTAYNERVSILDNEHSGYQIHDAYEVQPNPVFSDATGRTSNPQAIADRLNFRQYQSINQYRHNNRRIQNLESVLDDQIHRHNGQNDLIDNHRDRLVDLERNSATTSQLNTAIGNLDEMLTGQITTLDRSVDTRLDDSEAGTRLYVDESIREAIGNIVVTEDGDVHNYGNVTNNNTHIYTLSDQQLTNLGNRIEGSIAMAGAANSISDGVGIGFGIGVSGDTVGYSFGIHKNLENNLLLKINAGADSRGQSSLSAGIKWDF